MVSTVLKIRLHVRCPGWVALLKRHQLFPEQQVLFEVDPEIFFQVLKVLIYNPMSIKFFGLTSLGFDLSCPASLGKKFLGVSRAEPLRVLVQYTIIHLSTGVLPMLLFYRPLSCLPIWLRKPAV